MSLGRGFEHQGVVSEKDKLSKKDIFGFGRSCRFILALRLTGGLVKRISEDGVLLL